MSPPLPPSPPPPVIEPLVKLAEIPGRGRALVASRAIKAGEIILSESPLLLYPAAAAAATAASSSSSSFCSHCFRTLPSPNLLFCSPRCLSSHPNQTLTLTDDPDLLTQSNFLHSAHHLSLSDPAAFHRLLSLHSDPLSTSSSSFPLPSPFPPDLTAALLSKDRANAFALMEPFRHDDGGDRRVRAYGVYPTASFFNHDCLPNACRFDYIDGDRNTDIIIRAIHDVPEGRELCLSYFPVNWGYKERQKRLSEDYGFRCECDRCRVESNWKDDDDDDDERMEEEDGGEGMEGLEDEGDGDFPHAYFFVRYLCDRENCGGTLAPLPPSADGTPSDVMECNVCGQLRKEDDDVDGDGVMLDDE